MTLQMELQVLKCGIEFGVDTKFSKLGLLGGGYYLDGSEEAGVAKELMKAGLLEDSPVSEWQKSGWNLTPKGRRRLTKIIKDIRLHHGHEWEKNDRGNVNSFAYSEGYHNGYKCVNCGYEFCIHCTSEVDVPKCEKGQQS